MVTRQPAICTTQVNLLPDMIDLGIGQPDFNLLPVKIMEQAAAHRLQQDDPYLLNYGYEQGDGYCRIELAALLSRHYHTPVNPDSLLLTAGASQGLDLICTLFTRPGDLIFVEEPTYFIVRRIFADHKLRIVSLPTDEQGLIIDALQDELAKHEPALLYTIPTYQNPTGVTLSPERRAQLVELSQQHDLLVVADEVYQLLNYTDTPPAPLAAYPALYSDDAPILSLGSFSKILAPGLRLGWIQGGPRLLAKLVDNGLIFSGGGLNHFTSALVRSVLELGLLEPYLQQLKATYGTRAQVLAEAVETYLPTARFTPAAGGFFLWLQFPPAIDTTTLAPLAQQHNVDYLAGTECSSRNGLQNYMRLSFSFYERDRLVEGVKRLGGVLTNQ